FSFPKNASLQYLCLYAAAGGALNTEPEVAVINIDKLPGLYSAQIIFVVKGYRFRAIGLEIVGQPYYCSLL
ncbi:unnamed protein product, partial [marine sediment metagenome]